MIQALAILFVVATGLVVLFQLSLAAGAPWGAYAMGGAFPGRMPAPMRAAAVVQALLLVGLATIVLSRAGLAFRGLAETWPWLAWVPVIVFGLAVGLNASTRSQGERRIWLPVAAILLLCSLGVALGIGG